MASWKGELEVPAIDAGRLPTLVPALLDRLRALRFEDGLVVDPRSGHTLDTLRDTTGTHPAPGTTYSGWYHTVADDGDEDSEQVWRQWDLTVDADDHEHTVFRVVDAPGSDDVARLSMEIPHPSRPVRAAMSVALDTVDIDIDVAWDDPGATVGIVHRKFRAGIVVGVEPRDQQWVLHVEAALSGRGFRRPLFAIAMIALRRPIVRVFERELARVPEAVAEVVEEMAAHPDDAELADVLVDEWLDHVRD